MTVLVEDRGGLLVGRLTSLQREMQAPTRRPVRMRALALMKETR